MGTTMWMVTVLSAETEFENASNSFKILMTDLTFLTSDSFDINFFNSDPDLSPSGPTICSMAGRSAIIDSSWAKSEFQRVGQFCTNLVVVILRAFALLPRSIVLFPELLKCLPNPSSFCEVASIVDMCTFSFPCLLHPVNL